MSREGPAHTHIKTVLVWEDPVSISDLIEAVISLNNWSGISLGDGVDWVFFWYDVLLSTRLFYVAFVLFEGYRSCLNYGRYIA